MTILDISDIKLSYLLILVMVFVYTHVCVCGWLYNCTLYSSNMPALLTSAPPQTTKLRSFQRQLNLWGFKRISKNGPDKDAYYHEHFIRGHPEYMDKMVRIKIKGNATPSTPPRSPPLRSLASEEQEQLQLERDVLFEQYLEQRRKIHDEKEQRFVYNMEQQVPASYVEEYWVWLQRQRQMSMQMANHAQKQWKKKRVLPVESVKDANAKEV